MISWDEKYSIGDATLDKQHKMLFEFFNDFEIEIKEGRGISFMGQGLYFLEKYAMAHFSFEEDCMFKHKCPFAQRNKDAHKEFLNKFQEYKLRFTKEGYSDLLVLELHKFLEQWIKGHIIGIDTHLKDPPEAK